MTTYVATVEERHIPLEDLVHIGWAMEDIQSAIRHLQRTTYQTLDECKQLAEIRIQLEKIGAPQDE
jgi:hypothetical protein